MKHFIQGDIARALKSVSLDGTRKNTAVKRGMLYIVRETVVSCCHQALDIGYRHHAPIVNICSACGNASPEDHRLLIPNFYFAKARIPQEDALEKKLRQLEGALSRMGLAVS